MRRVTAAPEPLARLEQQPAAWGQEGRSGFQEQA